MVFAVPPSKASIDQNTFKFTIPGDETIHKIPLLRYAPTGVMEHLSGITRETLKFTDYFVAFDHSPEVAAQVRKLDFEQLDALLAAYQEESGITVGESQPSSENSTPTE